MTDIQTIHDKEKGQQRTMRAVTVTDENGDEETHWFDVLDDGGHEYRGDGQPPQAAVEALHERFETTEYTGDEEGDETDA